MLMDIPFSTVKCSRQPKTTCRSIGPRETSSPPLDDLANWGRLLYTGQAGLNQETVAMMMDVRPSGDHHGVYGLGCTYTEGLGYGHDGAHVGYLTMLRYNPENGVTIIAFCSILDAEDLPVQGQMLFDVGRAAISMLVSHPPK
jgi:CubicO group peptidase (beta-lactamase class C family)